MKKSSLINAIKKLLTKLGAQELEGNNLVEVINNGADAIEGGGGSSVLFVRIYENPETHEYESNKTYAEMIAVLDAGGLVIINGFIAEKRHSDILVNCFNVKFDFKTDKVTTVIVKRFGINQNGITVHTGSINVT